MDTYSPTWRQFSPAEDEGGCYHSNGSVCWTLVYCVSRWDSFYCLLKGKWCDFSLFRPRLWLLIYKNTSSVTSHCTYGVQVIRACGYKCVKEVFVHLLYIVLPLMLILFYSDSSNIHPTEIQPSKPCTVSYQLKHACFSVWNQSNMS